MALTPAGGVPISNESLEGGYILAEVGGNTRRVSSGDFTSIANMAASTKLFDGQTVYANGEAFTYDAASTATADGALIVTATGVGVGRLISNRTAFASFPKFIADNRGHPAGTELSIPSICAAYVAVDGIGTGNLGQANAGGQEFNVLPNENGEVSPVAFGAPVDGVSDDSAALKACFDAALADSYTVNLGRETYTYGSLAAPRIDLQVDIGEGQSFRLVGEGAVIKDYPGFTDRMGRFNRTLYFTVANNTNAESLILDGFTVDKNGASNTAFPTTFEYEQAHCIAIQVGATASELDFVSITNIITRDKVGGGIVFSQGAVKRAVVENCHGVDFDFTGGERGDLEMQTSVNDMHISNCSGRFMQLEPNVTTPKMSYLPKARLSNCDYRVYDLVGYSSALEDQSFYLSNCTNSIDDYSGLFWVRDAKAFVSGCHMRVDNGIDWRNAIGRFSDTTFVIGVDTVANSFKTLNISSVSLTRQDHVFANCRFEADDTADAATTGYAILNSSTVAVADASKFKVVFDGCEFSAAFEKTADCYRNGTWEFNNTSITSRVGSWAIQVGAASSLQGNVTVSECDLSNVSGTLFRVASASSVFKIILSGQMDYAKYSASNRPPSEWQAYVQDEAVWLSGAIPTGGGYLSQKTRIRKAPYGSPSEYVCSSSGLATGTWRMSRQAGVGRGTTANRPTLSSSDMGVMYMDTTLDADGKPIWWTGFIWIDATGVPA